MLGMWGREGQGGVTLQSLAAKVSTASDFANIGRKIEWVSSWRKNIAKFSKRLAETGNVSYHQGWEFAHRFSVQIARFLPKNVRMSDSLKNMSDSLKKMSDSLKKMSDLLKKISDSLIC